MRLEIFCNLIRAARMLISLHNRSITVAALKRFAFSTKSRNIERCLLAYRKAVGRLLPDQSCCRV
jgi:hypothetical protein